VSDEDLDLNDDNDLDADSASEGDSGSDNSAPPKRAPADKASGDKRVNDLMGKWQAEQARANKLERELEAARAEQSPPNLDGGSAGGGAVPPASEFDEFIRDDARRRLFDTEPKLAAAGLDASAITGSTLSEMKDSLKRTKSLVEGMETRLRGSVLREHGLDPEVVAGAHEQVQGVAEMSDAEFAKFLADRDTNAYR